LRLLLLAFLLSLLPHGACASPEYRIAELYLAAAPLPELPLARHFDAAAHIVSPSWRLAPQALEQIYLHPTFAPQIRALLEADPLVRFAVLDRYLRRNFARLQRASFYREGFVTLQYAAPQTTIIVPLSLVTVSRGEEALRRNLPLAPELFR
jgi:uncharacterized protein VirK/YbjX